MTIKLSAKVICFSNHKGGVGKTCSVSNIGAGLARQKKKVLLIDLDPQANLSISFGLKDVSMGMYEALRGEVELESIIYTIIENLDIAPSSLDLAGSEIELSSEAGRELILKEALSPLLSQYDYILIDCAPSIGLLTTNALTAADEVIIPLKAEYLSLRGVEKLKEVISKVKNRLNKNLNLGGVFINQFSSRKVLNREIADALDEHFSDTIYKTRIRDNISLAESPGKGIDVFRYNPKCNGAIDYGNLTDEILVRHGHKIKR